MTAIKDQKVVKNVPQLRFAEFSGDWQEKRLKDLFIKKTKKNMNSEEKYVLTNSATRGIVGQQDYFDKDIANQNNLAGYYVVEVDDFVYNPRISRRAPVGPLKRNNLQRGVMSPLYTVLKPNTDFLDFLEDYFDTKKWHRYMCKIANYGARHDRMNIAQADFMNMPVPFPSIAEQQKISNFLNTLDEWIENLKKQKEKLEAYKKGMMQKIFDQEIRFKDDKGRDFPKWEEKRVGDIADFSKGKGISKADIVADGANKCIRYGELYTDYAEVIEDVISRTNVDENKGVLSEKDDILIPSSGESHIDIATASCIQKTGILIGGDINIIKPKKSINGAFLAYYLTHKQKIEIAKMAQGHSVVHLYNSHLKQLKVTIPEYPEQIEIANFVIAIDNLIIDKNRQIKMAKHWKKGLMQQLFV